MICPLTSKFPQFGTVATFRAAIEEVAFTGRVVYIGYAKERVCAKLGCSFKRNWILSAPEMLKPADFGTVIELPEAQTFPVNQAVSRAVPLEQAADALHSWSDNPSRFRKIMVNMDCCSF
jgi:threonine dehydrogenase-like Zn-dependent dehydrogenase